MTLHTYFINLQIFLKQPIIFQIVLSRQYLRSINEGGSIVAEIVAEDIYTYIHIMLI